MGSELARPRDESCQGPDLDLRGEYVCRSSDHSQLGDARGCFRIVHYGLAPAKAADRAATLAVARAAKPERFTSSTPPKILDLPGSAWINPPLLPAEPAA